MIVNLNKYTYREIAREIHKDVIKYDEYSWVTENQVMNYFASGENFRADRFPNATYEYNYLVNEFMNSLPF